MNKDNNTKNKSNKFEMRQEKIKSIALNLFLTKGYHKTSLKDIIKESGGSLSSIYTCWGNKEKLFFAILGDKIKQDKEKLLQMLSNTKKRDLKTLLHFIAEIFVSNFNQKDTIALAKVVRAELLSGNSKYLKSWLEEHEKDFIESLLQEHFKDKKSSSFTQKNAKILSQIFCFFLREYCLERILIFNEKPMNKVEQTEFIDFIVGFFLKAIK